MGKVFCGRRGLQGGTPGSPQPGQTGPQPPRRAHVSRSTFARRETLGRLRRLREGCAPASGGKRWARSLPSRGPAAPPTATAPSPAVRGSPARPCGGVAWHTPAAGEGGAYLVAAEELPGQSAGRHRAHFLGLPSYSSSANYRRLLKPERVSGLERHTDRPPPQGPAGARARGPSRIF